MTSGVLGKALLTLNTSTLLFTVSTNPTTQPQTFNLRFCNQSTTDGKVRVAIGTGANETTADFITYDTALLANGFLEEIGIVAAHGEKVWVTANIANVSVRAFGME